MKDVQAVMSRSATAMERAQALLGEMSAILARLGDEHTKLIHEAVNARRHLVTMVDDAIEVAHTAGLEKRREQHAERVERRRGIA